MILVPVIYYDLIILVSLEPNGLIVVTWWWPYVPLAHKQGIHEMQLYTSAARFRIHSLAGFHEVFTTPEVLFGHFLTTAGIPY